MEKLKVLWKKLNARVALIGGVVVISTSLGTCHLMDSEEPGEALVEESVEGTEEAAAPSSEEVEPVTKEEE